MKKLRIILSSLLIAATAGYYQFWSYQAQKLVNVIKEDVKSINQLFSESPKPMVQLEYSDIICKGFPLSFDLTVKGGVVRSINFDKRVLLGDFGAEAPFLSDRITFTLPKTINYEDHVSGKNYQYISESEPIANLSFKQSLWWLKNEKNSFSHLIQRLDVNMGPAQITRLNDSKLLYNVKSTDSHIDYSRQDENLAYIMSLNSSFSKVDEEDIKYKLGSAQIAFDGEINLEFDKEGKKSSTEIKISNLAYSNDNFSVKVKGTEKMSPPNILDVDLNFAINNYDYLLNHFEETHLINNAINYRNLLKRVANIEDDNIKDIAFDVKTSEDHKSFNVGALSMHDLVMFFVTNR